MMRSPAACLRVRGSQCTIIRWVSESVWDGASVWRACACAYVCGWSFVLQLLFPLNHGVRNNGVRINGGIEDIRYCMLYDSGSFSA